MSSPEQIDFGLTDYTWTDYFLGIGLGFGAVFQLVCILAVVFSSSDKMHAKSNQESSSDEELPQSCHINNNGSPKNGQYNRKSANSHHSHRKNRHEKKKRK